MRGMAPSDEDELCEAVEKNDPRRVKKLLSGIDRPDPCCRDDVRNGAVPLVHQAILGRKSDKSAKILVMLLHAGANADCFDSRGFTPLHKAVELNFLNIVRILISWRCILSPSLPAPVSGLPLGTTPLILAVRKEHMQIIDCLVKAGAYVDLADAENRTPRNWADFTSRQAYEQVEKSEAEYKKLQASRNGRGSRMQQPANLDSAMQSVRNGTLSPAYQVIGCSLLQLAAAQNRVEVVKELVKLKAVELDAGDAQGYGPLHMAAQNGSIESLKVLLNTKADVNLLTNGLKTPLHFAAEYGHAAVVRELLRYGVVVCSVARKPAHLPIHLAALNGETECYEMLMSHAGGLPLYQPRCRTWH